MNGLLLAAFLLQAAVLNSGHIGGIVTTAGTIVEQSLPNARLELREGPGTPIVARSDSGGGFVFSNLAPGRYRLFVTKDGFIRQEYGQRSLNRPGIPIILAQGQQIRDIAFHLEPAPVIAGRVQDDWGDPIANVLVQALRKTYDVRGNPGFTASASALTDDRGDYRIYWVDPGEYFLYAGATYFPGVTDPSNATSVQALIGKEVQGGDFRLRRTSPTTVTGNTSSAITGKPLAAAVTLTPLLQDAASSRYRAQSNDLGRFVIEGGVPPGTYNLSGQAASVSGETLTTSAAIAVREVPFLPGAPPPFYDLRLTFRSGIAIAGQLFNESAAAPDLGRARVVLTAIDSAFPSPAPVAPLADGRFSIAGVPLGRYLVDVLNLPDDLYLKAVRFGAADFPDGVMDVQTESADPLQILLSTAGGHLSVTIFDRNDKPFAGVPVVLVPDAGRRRQPDQYRIATSDENGQVLIRGIPPGDYKLFGWESIEPNAWLNADFLHVYDEIGTPVHVAAGENAPLSIRSIPPE